MSFFRHVIDKAGINYFVNAGLLLKPLFQYTQKAAFMDTNQVLISPAELTRLQQTQAVMLIDTRDADAYAAGTFPKQ